MKEVRLRLKIKHNDWLLADTCPQAANYVLYFESENELKFYNSTAWYMYINYFNVLFCQTCYRYSMHDFVIPLRSGLQDFKPSSKIFY